MTALIDWSSPLWGVDGSNVHIGSSDDLGHPDYVAGGDQ